MTRNKVTLRLVSSNPVHLYAGESVRKSGGMFLTGLQVAYMRAELEQGDNQSNITDIATGVTVDTQ